MMEQEICASVMVILTRQLTVPPVIFCGMVLIVIITVIPRVQNQEVYVQTVLLGVSALKAQHLKVQRVLVDRVFSVEVMRGVRMETVLRGGVDVTPTIMEITVK